VEEKVAGLRFTRQPKGGHLLDLRWRVVLPGISGDIFLAILRLLWWLLLLGYAAEGPPMRRLILTAAWIVAFLWRYVFPRRSSPVEETRLPKSTSQIGLSLPSSLMPTLAGVYLLTAVAMPWWGAAFTGGCAEPRSVDLLWPPRPSDTAPGFPFILGALLIVLNTATFPLIEEFSMRGWVLVPLRQRIGAHWAVFVIALFFAFMHFRPSLNDTATIFVVALGYGYAVVATGSIWTAVAMHFAWNFTNYLLAAPTVHGYFREAFGAPVFRCGPSRAIVLLSSVAFAGLLFAARRRSD
jgi:membrane protease YdiL (CAAX protease family)